MCAPEVTAVVAICTLRRLPRILPQALVQHRVVRRRDDRAEAGAARRRRAAALGGAGDFHAQAENQAVPVAREHVDAAAGRSQGRPQVAIGAHRQAPTGRCGRCYRAAATPRRSAPLRSRRSCPRSRRPGRDSPDDSGTRTRPVAVPAPMIVMIDLIGDDAPVAVRPGNHFDVKGRGRFANELVHVMGQITIITGPVRDQNNSGRRNRRHGKSAALGREAAGALAARERHHGQRQHVPSHRLSRFRRSMPCLEYRTYQLSPGHATKGN